MPDNMLPAPEPALLPSLRTVITIQQSIPGLKKLGSSISQVGWKTQTARDSSLLASHHQGCRSRGTTPASSWCGPHQ